MKRFVRSTLVALSLFSVPVFANPTQGPTPAAAEETITLRVGNAKVLKVEGLTRIALGDIDIADVKVEGEDIVRIEGKKAGETTLLVWTGAKRKAYHLVIQS